jgi:hypothetical protein
MESTNQLDFSKPEHVSVICKGNQLTVHIKGTTSSIRLTYQLQEEVPFSDPVPNRVTYSPQPISGVIPYTTPPFPPRPPYGPTTSGVLRSPYPRPSGYTESLEW